MNRAKKKHGIENFKKEILFVFETEVEMNSKEAELVTKEFCLREDTYNLCPGGHGGFGYINETLKISSEKRSKYGKKGNIAMRNSPKILEIQEKRRESLIKNHEEGKYSRHYSNVEKMTSLAWTEKAKEKRKRTYEINQHQQGKNNSNYGKCWIYEPETNVSFTIEKNKLSEFISKGYKKGRKMKPKLL